MTDKKTVIKWVLILTLTIVAVFCFSIFGGAVAEPIPVAETNGVDEYLPQTDSQEPSEPTVAPAPEKEETPQPIYSVFPREAELCDGGVFGRVGGTSDETLRACYELGGKTYAICQTESNDYDFKAKENSVGIAVFQDCRLLTTTALVGEYCDSRASSAGLYLAIKDSREIRLVLLSFDSVKTVFSVSVCDTTDGVIRLLDGGAGVRALVTTDSFLKLSKVDTEGVCSLIAIAQKSGFSAVQSVSNGWLSAVPNSVSEVLEGVNETVFFEHNELGALCWKYSHNKGFILKNCIEKAVFEQILPIDEQGKIAYVCLLSGTSNRIVKLSDSLAVTAEKKLNEVGCFLTPSENGFLLFGEDKVEYICRHLDGCFLLSDSFDGSVSDCVTVGSVRYFAVQRGNQTEVLAFQENRFRSICSFTGGGNAILFVRDGLRLIFDSESRVFGGFGGKDVILVDVK